MCCPQTNDKPTPADAGAGAGSRAGPAPSPVPAGCTTEACPEITLVELKEAVKHQGSETLKDVAARRQYVNLDDQVEPAVAHPEYGRVIRFKARVQWASGDPNRSLAGKTVYWYAKPKATNRAGLTGTHKAGFDSAGSGTMQKATQTDAKGWTPVVEFYTTDYGGDEFDVFATDKSDYTGGLRAGTYVVWKKIWYAQVQMKTSDGAGKFEIPAASLTTAVGAYAKVFIEMVDSGEKKTGDYKENFTTVADAYTWADGYTENTKIPFKVVYSAVDLCIPLSTRQERTHTQRVTAVQQNLNLPDTFFPYDFNGNNWLKSVTATSDTGAAVTVPKVELRNPPRRKYTMLKVDFTGTGVTPTVGHPVTVTVKYYDCIPYNGWGGSSLHLVVCRGAMDISYGAGVATAIAGTSIHEPGHTLGLVKGLAWETSDASNSGHCKYQKCVMWYQGYDGRPTDFHKADDAGTAVDPSCHTHLRAKDMTRGAMTVWKFPR